MRTNLTPRTRENRLIPSATERRKILDQAVAEVDGFYESLDELRVKPAVDAETIRNYLRQFDFEDSFNADELVGEVSARIKDWSLHAPHPRYFGLFNPSSNIYGIAADLLVAGFNPQIGAWHHSPFGVEVEAHLIRFFAAEFGLGQSAFGHFTSGGSEANSSSVTVALTRKFPTFGPQGVRSLAGQPTIYCSREFHHSFVKIAHQCGLGRQAIRRVPVTDQAVMDVQQLRKTIAADRAAGLIPFMVIATAGTTNAGLVEPIAEIAKVAEIENLHLHVDAAWGGAAILSDQYKRVLSGIERADTITFDPHKLLSVPMAAGMFIVREHQWLRDAFGLTTDYVPQSPTDGLDNYRHSMQFSRRFIGLKLFMTLAAVGKKGIGKTIERQFELAKILADKLESQGFGVLNNAALGVVCFVPPTDWGFEHHDQFESLAERVCAAGQAWISSTKLAGQSCLRACITNHLTQTSDLDVLVDTLLAQRE